MVEAPRQPDDILDGRYRLVERLGRGGFGDVWRADELLPDGTPLRQVALKLLHTSLAASDWSAEARIIASLRHSALVTVYAAGVLALERSTPFVAMELLVGTSLADFVERGIRVPWRRALAWAREAAAALDVIHQAGVVHLDLKPANLFLPHGGGIKVLDFGIARQGSARSTLAPADEGGDLSTAAFMLARAGDEPGAPTAGGTGSYSVVGTPGFMAPEIFEDGEPQPATDAYALAACIVQLTTGRLPQQVSERPSDSASTRTSAWLSELQAATVRGRIRDIAADNPELPRGLVALLEAWLALDPVARGVEAGGMFEALDAVWRCPAGWDGAAYRGLAAYQAADEGKLFGRAADIARLARELVDQPCVVLHGGSGIGLTSLARAGVAPELARSFGDGRDDWLPCAIELSGTEAPDDELWGRLEPFARGLGMPLDEHEDRVEAFMAWAEAAPFGVVVLIDNLHHVLGCEASARRDLERLIEALASPRPGTRLIATLREEHVPALIALEAAAHLRPWLRFMSGLPPNLAHELVQGPAGAAGRALGDVEPIVEELQSELGQDGRRLPFVSLALARWAERGGADGAAWRTLGGVAGAVAQHADAFVAALDEAEREVAEALLLRLVSLDGEPQRVAIDDLDRDDPELGAILARLLGERLVIQEGGMLWLGHPALSSRWTWLHERRLLAMDRLAVAEELRQATRRWLEQGRPRSATWGRDRLRALEERGASLERELGDDERAFLMASRAAVRLGLMLRAVALACALGVVLLSIWFDAQLDERAANQRRELEYAETNAAVGHMITRSRRTDDPYLRVALLSGAIGLGSTDPMLPLELLTATKDLPPARFLSLERVGRPTFPWGPRWLIGASSSHATVLDFKPPHGEAFAPLVHRFRTHAGGMHDFVPIPFDSSFVTRGLDGQLKVWRLREDGQIALVAASPMRCLRGSSALLVAERAPVIACSTSEGLARWDLRRAEEVATDPFRGRALDVSADGRWIAAARLKRILLWQPDDGRRHEIDAETAPSVARFSPRDPLVALVRPGTIEIHRLDSDGEPSPLLRRDINLTDPVAARWSDSGLDLAVCNDDGDGEWHYLREGPRHPDDPAPPASLKPCRPSGAEWPKPLDRLAQYGEVIIKKSLGPRTYEGGWQLENKRLITGDLVMFDLADRSLADLTRVAGHPRELGEPGASVAMAVRDGDSVIFQVGRHVRVHAIDGEERLRREGHLLALCSDGRALSWRVEGEHWRLFGAKTAVRLGRIPRRPGFVIGTDPGCRRVLLQGLDGKLLSAAVEGDHGRDLEPAPVGATGPYVLEGYVYDARPSRARDAARSIDSGLWLAASDGAMVRYDGATAALTAYGHAIPRATAMADGPRAGDLLFADDSGVFLRRPGAKDRMLLGSDDEREWEDIAMMPDGKALLLAWAHGVALLDLEQRAVVGEIPLRARGRFAPWDDEGSLLVWAFSFMGEPEGEILPIGPSLARAIGDAASNLRARLGPGRRTLIELD